jgi:hypothetical protein
MSKRSIISLAPIVVTLAWIPVSFAAGVLAASQGGGGLVGSTLSLLPSAFVFLWTMDLHQRSSRALTREQPEIAVRSAWLYRIGLCLLLALLLIFVFYGPEGPTNLPWLSLIVLGAILTLLICAWNAAQSLVDFVKG